METFLIKRNQKFEKTNTQDKYFKLYKDRKKKKRLKNYHFNVFN